MTGIRWHLLLVTLLSWSTAAYGYYTNPLSDDVPSSSQVCYNYWQSVGPFHVRPTAGGANLTDPTGIGAVADVWISPTSTVAYAGAANGGVWRTLDFTSTATFGGPHWEPVTDNMPCNSISTISGADDMPSTVVAGCGFPSNAASRGGEPKGVMISVDTGATWTLTAFPVGWWVSSVLVSGGGTSARVFVAAKAAVYSVSGQTGVSDQNSYNISGNQAGGIWLSQDSGVTFTRVFNGSVSRLLHSPADPDVYFASLLSDTTANITANFIQQSTDGGATWSPWSSQADILSDCPAAVKVVNTQLAIPYYGSATNNFYFGAFTTDASGTSPCYTFWVSPDVASANPLNLIPHKPNQTSALSLGAQGASNFAIHGIDSDPELLFVAGTGRNVWRLSDSTGQAIWNVVSSIGAYTPPEVAPTYATTKSNTAPHSNARAFAYDPISDSLWLATDGGIYKRTLITSATADPADGDWISLTGDMSITEVYSHVVDPRTGAMALSAQDSSIMLSQFDGSESQTGQWSFWLRGDGTSVGIDPTTNPATFYGSNQNLAGLFFVGVNQSAAGVVSFTPAFGNAMCTAGTEACFDFSTPLVLNRVTPGVGLVCTVKEIPLTTPSSKCYSVVLNAAAPQSATALEFDSEAMSVYDAVTQYVYGGRRLGVDNSNVVFAVGQTFVWSRDTAACTDSTCITMYSGTCTGACSVSSAWTIGPWVTTVTTTPIAQHPKDYYINAVTDDTGHVWLTADFGVTWIDLNLPATSNLLAVSQHTTVDTLRPAVYFLPVNITTGPCNSAPLIIGTSNGVWYSCTNPTATSGWIFQPLARNWPHTLPSNFQYNPAQDTLSVAMFGRGIWTLQAVTSILKYPAGGQTIPTTSGCTTPLYPNVPAAANNRAPNATNGYLALNTPYAMFPTVTLTLPSLSVEAGANITLTLTLASMFPLVNRTGPVSVTLDFQPPGVLLPPGASPIVFQPTDAMERSLNWTAPGTPGVVVTAKMVIDANTIAMGATQPAPFKFPIVAPIPQVVSSSSSSTGVSSSSTATSSSSSSAAASSSASSTGHSSSSSSSSDGTSTGSRSSSSSSSASGSTVASSTGAVRSSSAASSATRSSSSSSGGMASSSSTGSNGGTVQPSDLASYLPLLTFSLHSAPSAQSSSATTFTLTTKLAKDIAIACGVTWERIMVVSAQSSTTNLTQFDVTFAISPALDGETSSAVAGATFLNFVSSSSSSFYNPTFTYYTWDAVVGSAKVADQKSAKGMLAQGALSLTYDMSALPGSTQRGFGSLLLADIASATGIPKERFYMLTLASGSVVVSFTVSPAVLPSTPAASTVLNSFLSAARDTSSALYRGQVTSHVIVGSQSAGQAGEPVGLGEGSPPSASTSWRDWFTRTRIIAIAAGGGGGLLVCLVGLIACLACKKVAPKQPVAQKPSPAAASQPLQTTQTSTLGGFPGTPAASGGQLGGFPGTKITGAGFTPAPVVTSSGTAAAPAGSPASPVSPLAESHTSIVELADIRVDAKPHAAMLPPHQTASDSFNPYILAPVRPPVHLSSAAPTASAASASSLNTNEFRQPRPSPLRTTSVDFNAPALGSPSQVLPSPTSLAQVSENVDYVPSRYIPPADAPASPDAAAARTFRIRFTPQQAGAKPLGFRRQPSRVTPK